MEKDRSVYLSTAAWPPLKDYVRRRLRQLASQAGTPTNDDEGAAEAALVEIRPTGQTYEAVDTHADLRCCAVGGRVLTGAPAGPVYPDNVGYCGVQLGEFFIHNQRLTAPAVRDAVKRLGLTEIHVRQGYTRCNLVVVRDGCTPPRTQSANSPSASTAKADASASHGGRPAVITADRGIAKVLASFPIDVLVVESGHVELPGFPCGFLGGASGSLAGEILFNGDLAAHPDCDKICRFIRERDRKPRWFSGFPLRDIGSIITLL